MITNFSTQHLNQQRPRLFGGRPTKMHRVLTRKESERMNKQYENARKLEERGEFNDY